VSEVEHAPSYFNTQSISTDDAFGDPALRLLKVGDVIQLERHGFYRVDRPYVSPLVPMVLFMVPGESYYTCVVTCYMLVHCCVACVYHACKVLYLLLSVY
jgi:tRNA synthetases class I (E and Q), anti-codon binding domain